MNEYRFNLSNGAVHITRRIIAVSPFQAICTFLRTSSPELLDALKGAPMHITARPV
jgi:hypothetical protein